MNNIYKSALLVFIVGIFFCPMALSQSDPAAGILPFSTQVGGPYDSIDLATSNISLQMPVRSKAGKLSFSYSLAGNSHAWVSSYGTMEGTSSLLGAPTVADLGARITYTTTKSNGETCGGQYFYTYSNFAVVDSTGAAHTVPIGFSGCNAGQTSGVTSDGSSYTVLISWPANCSPPGCALGETIYDPSGNKSSGTLTDPDGVTIVSSTTYGGSGDSIPTTTYTDTLGTLALTSVINSDAGSGQSDTYSYTDAGGTNRTITVNYASFSYKTNFLCTGKFDNPAIQKYFPTSVVLPTNAEFTLTYEQTPGSGYSGNGEWGQYTTGRIASLSLPSGGSVTYGYSGGNSGYDCNSGVVPTLTRSVYDNISKATSVWTYVNSNDSATPGNYTVTETDPAGDTITHYFSGEYETERIVNDVTLGHLSTTITCYNGHNSTQGGCTAPTTVPTLPVTQTDVYKFVYTSSGSSTAALTETKFDTYGNVTEVKNYDYGQAFPPSGTPLTDTTISYDSGGACGTLNSYIYDRPCSVTTVDSSAHQLSQTTYSYNSAGHATQIQRWVSGTTYLTYTPSYNSNGTISQMVDANGGITTYNTYSCNNLLPNKITYPNGLYTTQVWDCNGGVVTATTGMDTNTATMAYADPLYRPTTYTDQTSVATSYTYGASTPMTTEGTLAIGSSSTQDVLATLDGLGRTNVTQQRQQPSPYATFDSVETDYDLLGRVKRTTMPFCR